MALFFAWQISARGGDAGWLSALGYDPREGSGRSCLPRGVNGGSGVQTGGLSDSITASVGHPLSRNWMASANGSFTRTSGLLYLPATSGTVPPNESESYKTFYGGVQVTRGLGRYWSCFLSYNAQDQSINNGAVNGLVGQNAFSGFSQTFSLGITFAPKSNRLGEF